MQIQQGTERQEGVTFRHTHLTQQGGKVPGKGTPWHIALDIHKTHTFLPGPPQSSILCELAPLQVSWTGLLQPWEREDALDSTMMVIILFLLGLGPPQSRPPTACLKARGLVGRARLYPPVPRRMR